jgi:hypothetical protein
LTCKSPTWKNIFIISRVVDPDPYPDWIRIRIRIGSVFSDFVDPDPYWETGSRIRIQGQENLEILMKKCTGTLLFLKNFTTERYKIAPLLLEKLYN